MLRIGIDLGGTKIAAGLVDEKQSAGARPFRNPRACQGLPESWQRLFTIWHTGF